MNEKDLNEILNKAEIKPDLDAKQRAKERMLTQAYQKRKGVITMKTNQETTAKKQKQSGKVTPMFKITRQHWQGAVAMLLVCMLSLSAFIVSGNGGFLLGTTFRGYEDAAEQSITVSPDSIEAVKDYAGQEFTLAGLPEDELTRIKPEHIFLGGYLIGMTVQKVEVSEADLIVTVAAGEPAEQSEDVDFGDYADKSGVIAVSPEPFRDKGFYYQAELDVLFPGLSSKTEAIAQEDDLTVEQEITLTLENDSFSGTLTADDIDISGGFDSVAAQNLNQGGQNLTFTLSGKADGNFGAALFTIPGNKLEKGLDVGLSIGIGRVPEAVQSSPLYVNSKEPQVLRIFMDYDSFTDDINPSMLTLGGVMNEFEITGFEVISSKTVELTLNGGPSSPGTGTVTFDSAAVWSGRVGRVAQINVENVPEPLGLIFDDDIIIEQTAGNVAVTILKFACSYAWKYGTAQIRKADTTGSFFSTIGMNSKEKETQRMLEDISRQLDDISKQISVNNQIINKRLDTLEYRIKTTTTQANLDSIDSLFQDFKARLGKDVSASAYNNWCENNLKYSSDNKNTAKNYMNTLGIILKELDPKDDKNVLRNGSLLKLYEQTCKSGMPFEHNTFMAMASYSWDWDAAIANYLTLATAIVDYNRDILKPDEFDNLVIDFEKLTQTAGKTFTDIEDYINNQPYAKSYEQLVVTGRTNKLFCVVDQSGQAYMIADNLNSKYRPDYLFTGAIEPGTRTSRGFMGHGTCSVGTGVAWEQKPYLALTPKETYNSRSYSVTIAPDKATITAPDKITRFLQNMCVITSGSPMSLNDIFTNYLISYDNLDSRNIQNHWDVQYQWLYTAHTDLYRKTGSRYFNDRTYMVEASSVSSGKIFNGYSVTCEDGLYSNKQNVKAADKIAILMCAE